MTHQPGNIVTSWVCGPSDRDEDMRTNEFDQPIGAPLDGWTTPPIPGEVVLLGRTTRLEPLSSDRHTRGLWEAFAGAPDSLWTYMTFGPFDGAAEFASMVHSLEANDTLRPLVVRVRDRPVGFACFMRVVPEQGVAEIGSIALSPELQRTTASTEALHLMIDHLFELGYRRCEWKCDDLNEPSRAAARRLGFTYEGTFRSAMHYKGRNRDTAWFSIIDAEWFDLRAANVAWLDPDNFDEAGNQRRSLEQFRSTSGSRRA